MELAVVILSVVLVIVLWWGFTCLPREEWQILAVFPRRKIGDETWEAVNFTWYGLLLSSSLVFSLAIGFVLLSSINMSIVEIALIALPLLAICLPLSKLVAVLVERRRHTFTVGGAVFCAFLLAPWVILGVAQLPWSRPHEPITVLAALTVSYCFGEGLGRLGCISFGCCYGKPLSQLPMVIQKVFSQLYFRFEGKLKKVAYEGGLEGEKLVPIQALTCVIYLTAGLISMQLFLRAHDTSAFLVSVVITQSWRVLSEMWRCDYRGEGRFSAYQWMALALIPYALFLAVVWRDAPGPHADASRGISALWDPAVFLLFGGLWLITFIFYGKSSVIRSEVHPMLRRSEIDNVKAA